MRLRFWLQLMGWVTIAACAFVSGNLLWSAVRLPFLSGGGAAQGDLGLFMACIYFGGPVALASLTATSIAWAASRRSRGSGARFPGYRAFMIIGLVNVAVAPGVMAWLWWGYR
jgi:hypothetical protein